MYDKTQANQRVVLEFRPQPPSGLPKLTLVQPAGLMNDDDLQPWNEELGGVYEQLSTGPTIKQHRFKSRLSKLPQDYDVSSERTSLKGTPRLVLTSRETISLSADFFYGRSPSDDQQLDQRAIEQAYSDEAQRWNEAVRGGRRSSGTYESPKPAGPVDPERQLGRDFVARLRELLKNIPQAAPQADGMRVVLRELEALVERSPRDWLLLMMSGYLHIARWSGTGDRRDLAYIMASHLLDELCSVRVDQPHPEADGAKEPLYVRHACRLWKMFQR